MGTNYWSGDKAQFLLDKIKFKSGETELKELNGEQVVTDRDGDFSLKKDYEIRLLEDLKANDSANLFPVLTGNVAVADETTTPIDGHRSARLTQSSATNADYYQTKQFNVNSDIFRVRTCAFQFDCNSNAVVDSYRVELIINDGADRVASEAVLSNTGKFSVSLDAKVLDSDAYAYFKIYTDIPNDANVLIADSFRVDVSGKIVKNFQRENEYSARINDNATYENENTTWIASVTNPSTGRYDIVPVSGFFSARPNAVANRNDGSAGKSNYSYAESTKDLIVVRTTSSAGAAENGGFSIVLQRGLGDYKEVKDGTVYAGGDAAKLENHFSARISNNGSTATVKSQGATFISSVNRTGTGTVEINFPVGFFTVVPSVTASVLDNDRANATVLSSSQTMIVIKTHSDDGSTNFVDIEFDINVSRQGSDYKNTLDIDNIIVDGDSITTNHVLGGVEYKVNGKLWDGKQVYARSYVTASNYAASTLIDTIETGLNVIGAYKQSANEWTLPEATFVESGIVNFYTRYNSTTGQINLLVNNTTVFAGTSFTIEYVK